MNDIKEESKSAFRLSEADRKILVLLAEDSSRSYADLGKQVHLSAPAVHERVKKLKREGIIKATVALLDGAKMGRPLLSFVQVFANTIEKSRQIALLSSMPDIEEIHSVTGENGILLKIRTPDTQSLEAVLEKIHSMEGIVGTRSQIVLTTLLERGPSPL